MQNSRFVETQNINMIRCRIFGAITTVLVLTTSPNVNAQGMMPVPDVSGATIEAEAMFLTDPLFGGETEYRYTISSPTSAEGVIWQFQLDVSSAEREDEGFGVVRTYPVQGGSATMPMVDDANVLAPFSGLKGNEVVVVGQLGPSGWNGGLNVRGNVVFWAADTSFGVTPGSSLSGLTIRSSRPPTIRQVSVTPHWILEVEDHDEVTDEELEDAFLVEQSLPVIGFTLGPMDIGVGGFPHFSRLSTDMRTAEGLGWVTDATLVNSLEASLGTARDEVFVGNNGLALAELQNMLDLIDAAAPGVANQEFRDLVTLNVEWLIERVPNSRNTFIPVFTATPDSAELQRDSTFMLTMRHFNSALEGNPPLEGLRVLVRCAEGAPCANPDQLLPGADFRIDQTGEQLFSYVGENAGLDVVEVVENDFEAFERLALITVNWTADADLVVPAFVPPMILAGEGDTIFVTDRTRNIGTQDVSVATTTRYYISDSAPIDIDSATFLGEREVALLAEGEFSDSIEMEFVIPSGFTGDVHFLAACADDEFSVAESNEDNNCSFSEVEREFDTAMVADDLGANSPPIASDQSVVTNENTAVSITLVGQDDDGDSLTFAVQSGPTNGTLTGVAPDLMYTPNLNFSGLDSFTFIANDGADDSNVATVSITVNAVNFPPIANDQSIVTDEDVPLAVTLTGQDADGGTLTFSIVTVPINGFLSGTAPNLTYTPNLGFSGTDGFTFVANDGSVDSNVATVSIVVNPVVIPPPIVDIVGASVLEGDVGQQVLLFDVSLSSPGAVNDVSMTVSTLDDTAIAGEDYEATSVQVVFPAGSTTLTQSVGVTINGDFDVELDEGFYVELSNVSSNVQIGSSTAVGTIENDDLVSVTVSDTSLPEGNSGNTAFEFEVAIDQAHPTESVVVNLQTADGTAFAGLDYVAVTPVVTFLAGATTVSQNVTVDVVGDLDVEPDETFSVTISSASANAVALKSIGSGIILNDDSPAELDCTPATASPNTLWPPNHKLVDIDISGVLSENGDPALITVTGIEQDEPVNGLGDGDISPDGFGVGTDSPQVRRERSGTGDGRIYFISFDASDVNTTASCTGVVAVGVPHDQGQGSTPIDSGVRFDSTVP